MSGHVNLICAGAPVLFFEVPIPQKFAAEQAAFMLQGSYKFGDSCCAGALK
jgi:hypothetical protein